jgi:hypothetical protein
LNNIGHEATITAKGHKDDKGSLKIPYGFKYVFYGQRNFFTGELNSEYTVRVDLDIRTGPTTYSRSFLEFKAMFNNFFRPFNFLVDNKGAYQIGEKGLGGPWVKVADWLEVQTPASTRKPAPWWCNAARSFCSGGVDTCCTGWWKSRFEACNACRSECYEGCEYCKSKEF